MTTSIRCILCGEPHFQDGGEAHDSRRCLAVRVYKAILLALATGITDKAYTEKDVSFDETSYSTMMYFDLVGDLFRTTVKDRSLKRFTDLAVWLFKTQGLPNVLEVPLHG